MTDDLWTLNLSDPDIPRPELYLGGPETLRHPVLSPDGALLAYDSDETGSFEVYLRSFPDEGGRRLVSAGGGRLASWSPEENTVYYWTLSAGRLSTFMAARIQRNPTPVVLRRETLLTGNYDPYVSDLHPDGDRLVVGRRVVVVSATPDGESAEPERFFIVTNWFEVLRERMGGN